MLRERLREILLGAPAGPALLHAPEPRLPAVGPQAGWERRSHGLDQFFGGLAGDSGLAILDLGEVNQAKVSFITALGHRMYSEDFLHALDASFGEDSIEAQANPQRVREFLDQALRFPRTHFDGVLAWDALQYLARPLLVAVVARLHAILRPGGLLLSLFHSDEKAESAPRYGFRIGDSRTLLLRPLGQRRTPQPFNNRAIERLFQEFASVKFFLTRDRLREVIVRR